MTKKTSTPTSLPELDLDALDAASGGTAGLGNMMQLMQSRKGSAPDLGLSPGGRELSSSNPTPRTRPNKRAQLIEKHEAKQSSNTNGSTDLSGMSGLLGIPQ